MEEFGLGEVSLEGGKHVSDIGKPPFHGDFIFPVELFFAYLVGGIDEK